MECKKITLLIYVCLLWCIHHDGFAQSDSLSLVLITEENSNSIESNLELLQSNENEKINLNSTPINWPSECFLNKEKQTAIETYLHNNTPLLSIYELQNIPALNETDLRWLFNNCQLKNNQHWRLNDLIGKKYSMAYIHQQWRMTPVNSYFYQRAKIGHQYKNIRLGLAFENDYDEQYQWRPQQKKYGPDVINFFIQHEIKKDKCWYLLGNYRIHGGQGLLVGAGLFFSKGPSIMQQSIRSLSKVYPLANTSEYDRMFGAVLYWRLLPNVQSTLYASNVYLDATLYNNSFFSSINESGIHLQNNVRKNINEQTYGLQLQYTKRHLHIMYQNQLCIWDKYYQPNTYTYQKINHFGKLWYGQSLSLHYTLNNHFLFSEIAFDQQNDWALQTGVQSSLDKKISTLLLFRKYDVSYNAPHSMALGESNKTQNETGLLGAIQYHPNASIHIYGSIDLFKFPWIKYQINQPSDGLESILYFEKKIQKHSSIRMQYRYEEKKTDPIKTIDHEVKRHHFTFLLHHKFSTQFHCSYQYQTTYFPSSVLEATGNLHALTLKYQLKNIRFNYQLVTFSTDNYTARLYHYEQDVPYRFHFNMYYGVGIAHGLIIHYKLSDQMSIWLKGKWLFQTQNQQKETIKDIGVMLKFLF